MKNKWDLVFDSIEETSKLQTQKHGENLLLRNCKATEEIGEASQALLKHLYSFNSSQSLNGQTIANKEVAEEYIDLAICAIDLAITLGFDGEEEMADVFLRKIAKWKDKLSSTQSTPKID